MSSGPLLDTNSPLSAAQAERLNQALAGLDARQLTWLSGYLSGLGAAGTLSAPVQAPASGTDTAFPLVILYGSQTGNAEGVAELALERAKARGFEARLADMAEFGKKDFKAPANYLIVVSTQGEGDPPDTAEGFFELINGRKAPDLKGSRFSVLGLGDSSYEYFCQMGKLTDARFAELGAERILDRVDCDVDYDEPAERWIEATLDAYQALKGESQAPQPAAGFAMPTAAAAPSAYSRKNPFEAEVLESIQLNGRGSLKETHHIELSLEGSGLSYQPGDALGIVPQNDPSYVDEMLDTLAMDAEHDLGEGRLLRDALLKELEVTTLTRPFVKHWAELSEASELKRLLAEDAKDELRDWLYGRQLIDIVRDYPVTGIDAPTFVSALRKLPPRLYSIASSLDANPDEVHLTVGIVRYEAYGRARGGVTSTWLSDRVQPGDTVPIYIDHNKNFKLPESGDTPIIMVGPGTGIAPFRSFMQQREEDGAKGDNWLFFGDQHFESDFLYQAEWLNMRAKGLLTRLDVAFSRDQAEKIYVQDRMREKGRELYEWLENGAHFYVCGDGERMAVDVHNTLIEIAKTHGGRDEESATAWLRELQQAKRYQRDVY
ncbi:assimilatory sulfite reductase (NADPH) flavoprotein subunit [Halotalea alkalilenta]|uniref:Sulfite reductase [NADPH] flavoprotein alpha-component n=1 Tax=Halotalea alkalilenta TaxID=376489 RepID=A0A172YEQ5_9GAMM|nr:assimilatory sulfite reductase (NADPH) flavoprotein subunit [Halotalea alkalilenta]ANF57749.1 sulfite reductase [NADPH] flavoprotein alpha-component [Halotalea alkalilenta]